MNNVKVIVFLFCSLCVPFILHASLIQAENKKIEEIECQYESTQKQSVCNDKLILNEVLSFGILRNEKLKAAFYEWKAAVEKILGEKSLEDPTLSFRTFIEEIETRVGSQKNVFGISQKFPFIGKLSTREDIATDLSRQKYAAYQKVKFELLYQIKFMYFEYCYLHASIAVAEENQKLLIGLERIVQDNFRDNQIVNRDLLKIQIELARAANSLLSMKDYVVVLTAKFNALLNRDLNTPLGIPENIQPNLISIPSDDLLEQILLENNPDLNINLQRINEMNGRLRLAKLDFAPDFNVGVDYIQIDDGPLSVESNGNDAYSVFAKVNVPLWFRKQKGQLAAVKAQQVSVSSAYEQLIKDFMVKVRIKSFKIRDQERLIRLYRDALIPKAQQSFDVAEVSYRSGAIDFSSLIEINRELLSFRLAYYRTICDYEQVQAELEMLVGHEF